MLTTPAPEQLLFWKSKLRREVQAQAAQKQRQPTLPPAPPPSAPPPPPPKPRLESQANSIISMPSGYSNRFRFNCQAVGTLQIRSQLVLGHVGASGSKVHRLWGSVPGQGLTPGIRVFRVGVHYKFIRADILHPAWATDRSGQYKPQGQALNPPPRTCLLPKL